ncbi:MAG: FlgD Ig-like protein [Blastococcus sp.]|nr:FlgD Ig-like protein [Blastococcus sp.]
MLDTCQIEIRNAADTLVRALSCLDRHAATTVTWDGKDTAGALVPDGSYTWRIVGATDGISLADYDGSTSALSGAITVQPWVTAQSPGADSITVSQTANVTATFSAPVVTYNATNRTVTLNPIRTLSRYSHYRVPVGDDGPLSGT